MSMIRTIIALVCTFADKYGLDLATIAILLIGGYKLFTNHLAHISVKINEVDVKVTKTDKTLTEIDKRLSVQERICSERHSGK